MYMYNKTSNITEYTVANYERFQIKPFMYYPQSCITMLFSVFQRESAVLTDGSLDLQPREQSGEHNINHIFLVMPCITRSHALLLLFLFFSGHHYWRKERISRADRWQFRPPSTGIERRTLHQLCLTRSHALQLLFCVFQRRPPLS